MDAYPSPLDKRSYTVTHELRPVVPFVAALGFVLALAALGPRNWHVWVVGGLAWLFVALAWSGWAQRASAHWKTAFRDHDDYRQAVKLMDRYRETPGLTHLAPDIWAALSEASVDDEESGMEPNHGRFRALVEDVEELIVAARRNAGSVRSLERTTEVIRELTSTLTDRDPS